MTENTSKPYARVGIVVCLLAVIIVAVFAVSGALIGEFTDIRNRRRVARRQQERYERLVAPIDRRREELSSRYSRLGAVSEKRGCKVSDPETLILTKWTGKDEDLEGLGEWFELLRREYRYVTEVKACGDRFSDASLAHFTGLKELECLDLSRSRITDRGLPTLPTFELGRLVLDNTTVGDEGLARLAILPKLGGLSLRKTRVKDARLWRLEEAGAEHQLGHLDLSGTSIIDEGLSALRHLPQLSSLILDDTPVSDEGLKQLSSLRNLTDLSLCRTRVTGTGLKHFQADAALRSLRLDGCPIDGRALSYLERFPKLETLSLEDTSIGDEALDHLPELPALDHLSLRRTRTTNAGIPALNRITGWYWSLALDGCHITDDGLKSMPGCFDLSLADTDLQGPGLVSFRVAGCPTHELDLSGTRIDDESIVYLAGLRFVTCCVLQRTRITNNGLKSLLRCDDIPFCYRFGQNRFSSRVAEVVDSESEYDFMEADRLRILLNCRENHRIVGYEWVRPIAE